MSFNVYKYTPECVKRTEDLLHCISKHLSSKPKCRGVNYRVAIYTYDDEQETCNRWEALYGESGADNCIFFDTTARLCRHGQNNKSAEPAIWHIVCQHFPELACGTGEGNQICVKTDMLVPGVYEYKCSVTGKYRRWFKVKEV